MRHFCFFLAAAFCTTVVSATPPRDAACQKYLDAVARTLSRGDVAWDYPLESLKTDRGSAQVPTWLSEMEDEMVKVFTEVPPELRDWNQVRDQLHLSEDEMWDLRAYYGLNVFNQPGILDAKTDLIGHARRRAHEEFLRGDHPAAGRYEYYRKHLGHQSVPQMAESLGLREGDVYRELSLLGISLAQEFDRGAVREATPADLFARHHARLENRTVDWDRVVMFRGVRRTETEVLIELLDEGLSYQAIAAQLNALAGRATGADDVRSELSVSAKVQQMGLTKQQRRSEAEVVITPYGLVKASGRLVPTTAGEFLFDHRDQSPAWLADQLGVQEGTLVEFIRRQHLDVLLSNQDQGAFTAPASGKKLFLSEKEADRVRKNFELNLQCMDRLIEHLAQDDVGVLPPTTEHAHKKGNPFEDVVGVNYGRFTGKFTHGNLNASRTAAMQNTLRRLDAHPHLAPEVRAKIVDIITKDIEAVKFESLSKDERRVILEDRLITYLAQGGVEALPGSKAPKSGVSPFAEVLGTGYSPFVGNHSNPNSNLNPSRLAAMENTLKRLDTHVEMPADVRAKVEKILRDEISDLSFDRLGDIDKRQIVEDRLIAHLAREDVKVLPSTKQDRGGKLYTYSRVLGMDYVRFFGTATNAGNLNPSRIAAMENTLLRLKAHAKMPTEVRTKIEAMLKVEIEELKFEALETDLLRREVVEDRLIEHLAKDGITSLPPATTNPETGRLYLSEVLGVNHQRFVGTGTKNGLNPSRLVAMENTLVRLESHSKMAAETRAKVEKILKREVETIKFDALKDDVVKRNIVEDRLIEHLAREDVSALPSTKVDKETGRVPFNEVIGVTYQRFSGVAQSGKLNTSRLEAMRNCLARLDSTPVKLSPSARAKVKAIFEAEIARISAKP